jgi:hypothetical protein
MKNRHQSYKKVLLSIDELISSKDKILYQFEALKNKELSPMDFTTLYLLLFLRIRSPKNYLQQKSKQSSLHSLPKLLDIIPNEFELTDWEKTKLENISGLELFLNFSLKGFPLSINRSMINWYEKKWDIVLWSKIPSAKELLFMQVENKRVLTLIQMPDKLFTHILGKRDPLSFALHDLMHADHFFNNEESVKGQLGFYHLVSKIYDDVDLSALCEKNKLFKEEFDYVVSDMNAYIIHMLKSFKSCFSRANEDFLFLNLIDKLNIENHIKNLLIKINNEDLTIDEELALKLFFESNKKELV